MAPDLLDRTRAALARAGAASPGRGPGEGIPPPGGRGLRPAAVLVPVVEAPGGHELILTRRSPALKHHPGQIAFPGGKRDESDGDLVATALREAREEIGLRGQGVEVLGVLAPQETVTAFAVTPVVALVAGDFDAAPEAGEVSEVFRVPLSHVLRADNFRIEARRRRGRERPYDAIPYGPYYIWGTTARILRAWADLLQQG